MALGEVIALHEDMARADLQQFYGIDLDAARRGAHTARHVAALVACLPRESRIVRAVEPRAAWSVEAVLQAQTFNALCAVFGGEDAPRIDPPGYEPQGRAVSGLEMTPEELMAALARPRTNTETPATVGGE